MAAATQDHDRGVYGAPQDQARRISPAGTIVVAAVALATGFIVTKNIVDVLSVPSELRRRR